MIQSVCFLLLYLVGSSLSAPSGPNLPNHPNVKIVGGKDAERGEFPYQISYQIYLNNGTWLHFCGGSIMSPSWILIAAHCIIPDLHLSRIRVVAGILNQNETDTDYAQVIGVDELIVHEEYPGGTAPAPNDIALIKLSSLITYNDDVQNISLPAANSDCEGDVMLSGWGRIAPSEEIYPDTLQKVEVPLLNATLCEEIYEYVFAAAGLENAFRVETNICTGPLSGGISACSGDSGGPLAQNGTLVGIVSWGSLVCGLQNAPSVYVRVSNYIDWIEENTLGEVTVG